MQINIFLSIFWLHMLPKLPLSRFAAEDPKQLLQFYDEPGAQLKKESMVTQELPKEDVAMQ